MTDTRVRAGAGRALIALPDALFPHDGFVGVHDPLHARALVLEHGPTRLVVLSLELPSLRQDLVDALRERLAGTAATTTARVWVCVTHTLGAPHVRSAAACAADEDVAARSALLAERVTAAADAATADALAGLRPCVVGTGSGTAALNVSRDHRTADGWTHAADLHGYSDHTLTVVRVDDTAGRPIALLYAHDLRPSTTERTTPGRRMVTGDCPGAASQSLEDTRGGVAIFLPGAMADQMPATADLKAATADPYALASAVGAALADAARELASGVDVSVPSAVLTRRCGVTVPDAEDGTGTTIALELLGVGEIALLGMAPELTSVLGSRIRSASPWAGTVVTTMLNGGAKYLVDDEARTAGTRTASASPFGAGAGTLVVTAAGALLHDAHDTQEHR